MKSAKKGVSVEEWRARWWTGEDARVRAVQGAARRCTAGVGRWSRRRRMLLPTLLIISGVGGRLAQLADGVLG